MSSNVSIPAKEKLTIITNLSTMLGAGIPVLESVETLLPDSKGGARKFLQLLRDSLAEGKPISEAMATMPRAFDPVAINLMKAGEEAGTLEETLKDLATGIKRDAKFREELKASMTYPLFIFVIFLGILTLILTFVVPRISKVFLGLNVELPAVTRFMMMASAFVTQNYIGIIIGTIIFIIFARLVFKAKRRQIIGVFLGLPLLKNLGRQIDLARFTHSMSLLLRAGVTVPDALELSQAVVTKKEMIRMVEDMRAAVGEGKPMSEGLHHSKKIVPTIMVHILETAERSGTLDKTMQDLSVYFQEEVTRLLKVFSTLIEPIMIVFIGVFVGGMMMAIIAPIYGLMSQIAPK